VRDRAELSLTQNIFIVIFIVRFTTYFPEVVFYAGSSSIELKWPADLQNAKCD